jgi:flagellar hook protein FlgE
MHEAESQLDTTASHIARIPFSNSAQDTVDLSSEMVNLLEARTNFAANTKVVHVADEIQQSTLSILA